MTKRKSRRKRTRQSSTTLLQNGLKSFRSGDYDGAIETWERVGKQSPQMLPAAALAQVYFRRGLKHTHGQIADPKSGLSDLKQANTLQPGDPCYIYHLGLAAHRLGELDRALAAYRAVRRDNNEFTSRAAYPLAVALLQQGREPSDDPVWPALSEEEQEMLHQVKAFRRRPYTLSPDAPVLWRALAALDAGEGEQPQTLLEQALDRATPAEEGIAHYYLGVLAAREDDWDTARHHWNTVRASGQPMPRLADAMGEVYHRLAEERLESGDAEGALAAGMESLRQKPDDKRLNELISQAHQRLAYAAASSGQWTTALEHWEAADAAEGGSFRLAYNLALAYERAEDFITAGEKWREALRRRPRRADHPDAIDDEQVSQLWRRAAEAYCKAGEYDEAVHVCRQAVKWNPDHLNTRLALTEMLLSNGQWQAAENELNRILEHDPDNIPALLRLGEVIPASSNWWWGKDPVTCWERVLELEPDNATARQLLADFYQNQAEYYLKWRNPEEAIELYNQALSYLPNDGHILAALGSCYLGMNEQDQAEQYFERALAAGKDNLRVYEPIIRAWLDAYEPDRAWELMSQAEATIETIPYEFYINQAFYCIQDSDMARPWLVRAVENAPPDEPVFMIIAEIATSARAWAIAREYLERALAEKQHEGQAHLLLGIVNAQESDLATAEKHWNSAKEIARRKDDPDLMERIEMARMLFSGPPGLASLLMSLGGGSFGPFPGFDEDENDDYWD